MIRNFVLKKDFTVLVAISDCAHLVDFLSLAYLEAEISSEEAASNFFRLFLLIPFLIFEMIVFTLSFAISIGFSYRNHIAHVLKIF